MKNSVRQHCAVGTIVLALLACAAVSAAGQSNSDPVYVRLYGGLGPPVTLDQFNRMAEMPTPRTADGHPDLTGYWGTPPEFAPSGDNYGDTFVSDGGSTLTLGILNPHQIDQGVGRLARERNYVDLTTEGEPSPTYKPEWRDRAEAVGLRDIAFYSPVWHCLPVGVPGVGAPWEIVQTSTAAYFLDGGNDRTDSGRSRIIPLDGRPHREGLTPKPMGDSIGHWDGDTLVVETVNLSDWTWLASRGGLVHSDQLRVVERLTRRGNTLEYETTVHDPVALEKPWVKVPQTFILTPGMHVKEDYPCINRGAEHHEFNSDSQGYELDPDTLKRLEQLPYVEPLSERIEQWKAEGPAER